jgi:hypothetical protein
LIERQNDEYQEGEWSMRGMVLELRAHGKQTDWKALRRRSEEDEGLSSILTLTKSVQARIPVMKRLEGKMKPRK